MMITPQACRRITGAVEALGDTSSKERWITWVNAAPGTRPHSNVPYDVAEIALGAIVADEQRIRELLAQPIDEDTQADLLNDLGYIQAIETALRNDGVGR